MRRKNGAVPRVRAEPAAAEVISNENGAAEHSVAAVVAATHAGGRARLFVLAAGAGRSGRVAPWPAQQRGVLPHCQRQDDQEDSCSKHVMLDIAEGKHRARAYPQESSTFPTDPRVGVRNSCGISPMDGRKSRSSIALPSSGRLLARESLAPRLLKQPFAEGLDRTLGASRHRKRATNTSLVSLVNSYRDCADAVTAACRRTM